MPVRTCHAMDVSSVHGRMNSGIQYHEKMDVVVPLAVWFISHNVSDIEAHEDVTWVDKYDVNEL